jgi:hypothetical protein
LEENLGGEFVENSIIDIVTEDLVSSLINVINIAITNSSKGIINHAVRALAFLNKSKTGRQLFFSLKGLDIFIHLLNQAVFYQFSQLFF